MADTYVGIAHPFAPVYDTASHVLVLGTFPSVKSRENLFYYGHPQNRFWRVLALLFHEQAPETIPEKRAMLLEHGVAIWDVLASCDITGSSDLSIRKPVPNDIAALLSSTSIHTVFCNGQTAGSLYHRWCEPSAGLPAIILPSTSPANARWTLDRLTEAWMPLARALRIPG